MAHRAAEFAVKGINIVQAAQRCGRGVSAILSEKWRLNSSCRSERRPSGPRKMAVDDGI